MGPAARRPPVQMLVVRASRASESLSLLDFRGCDALTANNGAPPATPTRSPIDGLWLSLFYYAHLPAQPWQPPRRTSSMSPGASTASSSSCVFTLCISRLPPC